MQDRGDRSSVTLLIELEPGLGREVERAAERQHMLVTDFVVEALRRVLATEIGDGSGSDRAEWSQLSAASFARDWQSDEDRVYDQLP
jgi:hypothetical protein